MDESNTIGLDLCHSLQQIEAKEEKGKDVTLLYKDKLVQLSNHLAKFNKDSMTRQDSQVTMAHVLIIAAGHSGKHYWTNSDTRQLATDLISTVMCLTSTETRQEMLVGKDGCKKSETLLLSVLTLLRENLTKNKWKDHPLHKQALVWCIKQLKHPDVSPHLDTFLPVTLMILDDHTDYHKMLALGVATHIVSNVDPTELRWYNRADVLYEAMKPLLYGSSPEVTSALHTCLLKLLPVLDAHPKNTPAKPNKSSEVFELLLNSLYVESKLSMRKVYASFLSRYIDLLGIYCVRHMKLLLSVLTSCIEDSDYSQTEETRRCALQALTSLITHAWPRISSHKEAILKTLVCVVSDVCPSSSDIPDEGSLQCQQLQLVTLCFTLMAASCPDLKECYSALIADCQHAGLHHCFLHSLT